MKEKLQRFMMGRYGADALGKFMIGLALVLLVVSIFFRRGPWYLLALVVLILTYFRMFSRNVQKRYAENQWYLKKIGPVKGWFARQKSYAAQRKTHHIYTCPNCKQKIRVPKGKGKISIRCSKCGTEFIKRS